MSILNGELARTIGHALAGANLLYPVTVIRNHAGSPNAATPWVPGEAIGISYRGQGFVDTYTTAERAGTSVRMGDVKIVLVATRIDIVPTPADTIEARGVVYNIVDVQTDPAAATFTIQARM